MMPEINIQKDIEEIIEKHTSIDWKNDPNITHIAGIPEAANAIIEYIEGFLEKIIREEIEIELKLSSN